MWSLFRALKRSWAQHFVSQISGFVILTMTYSAVIFIALALFNMEKLFSAWGQISQVTVYLSKPTVKGEVQKIEAYLKDHELVKGSELIGSKVAADRFNKRFKGASIEGVDSSMLSQFFPQSFQVQLVQEKAYKGVGSSLDTFAHTLKQKFKSVTKVSYGEKWLKRYQILLNNTQKVGWFLISSFLIGSLIIASSVIKTILFNRKDEVEILEFIGADDWMIYLPQVVNVMCLSLVAFVSAMLINYGVFQNFTSTGIYFSGALKGSLEFLPLSSTLLIWSLTLSSLLVYSVLTIYRMMPRQNQKNVTGIDL